MEWAPDLQAEGVAGIIISFYRCEDIYIVGATVGSGE
jgi:hypothetical protein